MVLHAMHLGGGRALSYMARCGEEEEEEVSTDQCLATTPIG